MKKPIVINLSGAPGAGKSTGAAKVFSDLKQHGVNCELVGEFAKDKAWERNTTALKCQEYVFGKQSYRLARCRDDVDVIVTDSPLPLTIIYNYNQAIKESLAQLAMDVYDTYENINFFINRVNEYSTKGRAHTAEESEKISAQIKELYENLGINYESVNGDNEGYQYISSRVISSLKERGIINE